MRGLICTMRSPGVRETRQCVCNHNNTSLSHATCIDVEHVSGPRARPATCGLRDALFAFSRTGKVKKNARARSLAPSQESTVSVYKHALRFGYDFSRPTNAQHVRKRANLWSAWAALCSSRSVLCLLSRHHHHHPALLRLHRSQHQRSLFRKSQCFLNRRHRRRGMLHT